MNHTQRNGKGAVNVRRNRKYKNTLCTIAVVLGAIVFFGLMCSFEIILAALALALIILGIALLIVT